MDPLSVVASVTGVLAVTAKITSSLTGFVKREKEAPKSIQKVITEVSDLNVCLAQLAPYIQKFENVPKSRAAHISVEQVIVINTSCVLALSELEEILDSFKLNQPLSTMTKIRWARQEQTITTLLLTLRASTNSLNLILTILSWWVLLVHRLVSRHNATKY